MAGRHSIKGHEPAPTSKRQLEKHREELTEILWNSVEGVVFQQLLPAIEFAVEHGGSGDGVLDRDTVRTQTFMDVVARKNSAAPDFSGLRAAALALIAIGHV